jgi:hypothetical protein
MNDNISSLFGVCSLFFVFLLYYFPRNMLNFKLKKLRLPQRRHVDARKSGLSLFTPRVHSRVKLYNEHWTV